MSQSELEAEFERLLCVYGIGGYEREYRFCPGRRFPFDFAWPDLRVAVECEGGVWTGGAHGRGWGISRDIEKYNLATSLGWKILRCTSAMLRDDPAGFMELVKGLLEGGNDEHKLEGKEGTADRRLAGGDGAVSLDD